MGRAHRLRGPGARRCQQCSRGGAKWGSAHRNAPYKVVGFSQRGFSSLVVLRLGARVSHIISVGSYRNFKALTTMQMEMPGMHSLVLKKYVGMCCTIRTLRFMVTKTGAFQVHLHSHHQCIASPFLDSWGSHPRVLFFLGAEGIDGASNEPCMSEAPGRGPWGKLSLPLFIDRLD